MHSHLFFDSPVYGNLNLVLYSDLTEKCYNISGSSWISTKTDIILNNLANLG